MDRQIVYLGQVPMDTDVLNTNLDAYIGLAKISAAILGTTTQLNGLACTQNTVPDMTVLVGAGEIYKLAAIDTDAYGSLAPNSTQILKQGINLSSTHVTGFTAPGTPGQSVNYLIQCTLTEVDNGEVVLPYYNSANPSQAFDGPNNSAQPQYTNRADAVGISIKAGTPAATGTQTTPSPDAGYVGAWVVTIAQGATTIVNGNISVYASAPFIPTTITNAPTKVGIQNSTYNSATDTGTANAYAVALTPTLTAYAANLCFTMKAANANTGACTVNVDTLGVKNIKLTNGLDPYAGAIMAGGEYQLFWDGTNLQLLNPSSRQVIVAYAADSGSANAIVVAPSPAFTSYFAGMTLLVKMNAANTGATTINANSLGNKNVKLESGADPYAGAMLGSGIYAFSYDGTSFILQNPTISVAAQNNPFTYCVDSGSANAYVLTPLSPITAYAAGQKFIMKAANANTGASTVNVSSLGVKNFKTITGLAFIGGEVPQNALIEIEYDGTEFRLCGYVFRTNIQRITSTGAFTFTKSAGCYEAEFELQAAGGGGGGTTGAAVNQACGGAGGAGSYLKVLVSGSANLNAITGSVGTAGAAGASGNNPGGTGGSTTLTINSGTQWVAAGGSGGDGQAHSNVVKGGGLPGVGQSNTVGTNGTTIQNIVGASGIQGLTAGASNSGVAGVGGNSILGSGGFSGNAGTAGGGGGGFLNFSGGNSVGFAGGNGLVVVTEKLLV